MQGRDDVAGFIAGFAGDDRYIVDYLAEEVLQRQPDHVRDFLLQTSVLDRLSGPLCDAVTGQDGGKAMLEALDRANLFLVPLDDRRRWYRYHHLFADVLRAHLLDEQPERGRRPAPARQRVVRAERRAVGGDPPRAGRRGRRAGSGPGRAGHPGPAQEPAGGHAPRLARRPPRRGGPRPAGARSRLLGALMQAGEFEGVEDRLRDAERWLDTPVTRAERPQAPPAGMVVVDEAEFRRLPGRSQMYRAALALVRGDVPATISHAQRALDRAAEDDHLDPGRGIGPLGARAAGASGDLEAAHAAYAVAAEGLRRAGHISDVLGCSITLADIRITQGRLGEALRTYEQALRLAADQTAGQCCAERRTCTWG